jgi:hypothetical protein
MITQQRENPYSTHPIDAPHFPSAPQHYYAEVPVGSLDEQSRLIEQVIRFALDTLGVYHLDVRVRGAFDVRTQFDIH